MNGTEKSRRVKCASLPKRMAIDVLRGIDRLVGLPDDAVIVGFFHDHYRDHLGVYIQSENYPEVPEGEVLEHIDLMFERRAQ